MTYPAYKYPLILVSVVAVWQTSVVDILNVRILFAFSVSGSVAVWQTSVDDITCGCNLILVLVIAVWQTSVDRIPNLWFLSSSWIGTVPNYSETKLNIFWIISNFPRYLKKKKKERLNNSTFHIRLHKKSVMSWLEFLLYCLNFGRFRFCFKLPPLSGPD